MNAVGSGASRRDALRGLLLAAVGAVSGVLAAKLGPGGSEAVQHHRPAFGSRAKANSPSASASPHPSATHGGTASASESPSASSSPKPTGHVLVAAADVPVGGAKRVQDPKTGDPMYVVHEQGGSFRAFSAICTHAGCTVVFLSGRERFGCPCHGAVYDARTGDVLGGPAPRGLPEIPVTVSSGQVVMA